MQWQLDHLQHLVSLQYNSTDVILQRGARCAFHGTNHLSDTWWTMSAHNVFSTMRHCLNCIQRVAEAAESSVLTNRFNAGLRCTFIRFRHQQPILQLHIPGRMGRLQASICRLSCAFRLRLAGSLVVRLKSLVICVASADRAVHSDCAWQAACDAELNQPVGSRPLLGSLLQIYADGHCGALRQRDLLSSDATVLAVTSLHEMWFTRLLLPW